MDKRPRRRRGKKAVVQVVGAEDSHIARECGDISAAVFDVRGKMLTHVLTAIPWAHQYHEQVDKVFLQVLPLESMHPIGLFVTDDTCFRSGRFDKRLTEAGFADVSSGAVNLESAPLAFGVVLKASGTWHRVAQNYSEVSFSLDEE